MSFNGIKKLEKKLTALSDYLKNYKENAKEELENVAENWVNTELPELIESVGISIEPPYEKYIDFNIENAKLEFIYKGFGDYSFNAIPSKTFLENETKRIISEIKTKVMEIMGK